VGNPDHECSSSFPDRSAEAPIAGASPSRNASIADAIGRTSKFATEMTRSSGTSTNGFPWAALSSIET
jgi:hypothetical protein